MNEEDVMIGASFAGRYRVVRKLGQGGMGAVYEALGPSGTPVALKLIHDEIARQNPDIVARFFQESRASAGLRCPHIVSILDSGMEAERRVPFLVMELLRGTNVRDLIDRVGPLEPGTAVRIAIEAARGLSVAHDAGIVHRDVKPENLFLASSPSGEVVVKVCDFGIAKLTTGGYQLTQTGHVMGSLMYMSPEQSRSAKHVDVRSDVWSLAVTLYEMLSGRTPCDSEARSMAEVLVAISTIEPLHLQDAAPWIEPELVRTVHRGLVRNAAERCPSMPLFEASLSQFAVASDLHESTLRGVSAEERSRRTPRAMLSTWQDESSAEVDQLLGKVLAGRYRLARLLGRGGMGAVYEAVDQREERRVAVKVILAESSAKGSDARRRFVREARAVSSIASPHVVRVIDADTDAVSDAPFIVMDLLSGIDLDQLIRERAPLEPHGLARLFLQACEGLAVAHAQSLVHRDIKPANLFLHQSGPEVTVKVCDFGVAKNTASEALEGSTAGLTRTGGLLGSPLYMSPEQAKNAKFVDARSDIWSLCLTMYEALSGVRPWEHCSTIGELILAICTENVAPLSDVAPWVDERLAAVVDRGVRRQVAERWQSVAEVTAALRAFTQGEARVSLDMLTSVSDEARAAARRARQAALDAGAATVKASKPPPNMPSVGQDAALAAKVGTTHPGLSTSVAAQSAGLPTSGGSQGRSRRGLWLAGLLTTLLLGGAGSFLALKGQSGGAPSESAKAASPVVSLVPSAPRVTAEPPAPASRQRHIAILPANASVTVDGSPRPLDAGALMLEGDPGDTFLVVVMLEAARVERRVSILKDGGVEPSSIELPAPKTAAPPAAARVSKPASAARPGASPPRTPVAAPASPAPAVGTPAPDKPGFQKEW